MKKLIFIITLLISQIILSQENDIKKIISNNSDNVVIRDKTNYQNVLYIVDRIPTFSDCSVINTQNIESVNVLKGKNAIELYGIRAKNGVVIIDTKPNTKLLNLENLIKKYRIKKRDRKLPIILNKHFVDEKEYLLLDKSAIISVKILDEQPFVEPVLLPKGKAIYIEAMDVK